MFFISPNSVGRFPVNLLPSRSLQTQCGHGIDITYGKTNYEPNSPGLCLDHTRDMYVAQQKMLQKSEKLYQWAHSKANFIKRPSSVGILSENLLSGKALQECFNNVDVTTKPIETAESRQHNSRSVEPWVIRYLERTISYTRTVAASFLWPACSQRASWPWRQDCSMIAMIAIRCVREPWEINAFAHWYICTIARTG